MVIDIVKKVGIAKGTFYHYFPTKEAILHAIITRHMTHAITTLKNEICHLPALHQLQLYIKSFFLPHPVGVIFDRLQEENQWELVSELWHKIQNIFTPLLIEIIQQGEHEKAMRVSYLNETIPFFWSNLNCLLSSAHTKEDPHIFAKKLHITKSTLEQILGIKKGSLDLSAIQQQGSTN